jgi:hypothetical protein
MGLFSLDFEKLYEDLSSKGEQILGMFCIQYPIYCIHSVVLDSTKDPLDSLDKVIVDFLIAKPNYSLQQLGALLGASKSLIEFRINKLIYDGHLITENNNYFLSELGTEVFVNKTITRQHRKSYDFYIDGITLKPLSKIFYTFYSSKYLNENDTYLRTNSFGITKLVKPFGPDIVHTPLSKSKIIDEIKSIEFQHRDEMNIPLGLMEIEDFSFSKLTLHCIVNVTKKDNTLKKELIDGNPIFSISDNTTYYDAARKNVFYFEKNLKDRIKNLQFKIVVPRQREENNENFKPILSSNWQEIDRHNESENKCFSFSSEDLVKVIEKTFEIKNARSENIVNEESEISIDINKEMLLNAPDRKKLISNIIRKRDYKFGNTDNNVFILYIYFKTTDEFVRKVVALKSILNSIKVNEMDVDTFTINYPEYKDNLRNYMVAAGEYEVLEKLDVNQHMLAI